MMYDVISVNAFQGRMGRFKNISRRRKERRVEKEKSKRVPAGESHRLEHGAYLVIGAEIEVGTWGLLRGRQVSILAAPYT